MQQQQVAAFGRANILVEGFSTKMVTRTSTTLVDGKPVETTAIVPVDYVKYCQSIKLKGLFDLEDPVEAVLNPKPMDRMNNIAMRTAHQVKATIEPMYRAWKSDQKAPEFGTPLSAWTAVPETYREIVRRAGVTTIEQLADATDSTLNAIKGLPNIREVRDLAKKFVNAKDANQSAAVVAMHEDRTRMLESQNSELRASMEEMRVMMAELMADKLANVGGGEDAPKRRGRPPNSERFADAKEAI